jgi:hypothetical protein
MLPPDADFDFTHLSKDPADWRVPFKVLPLSIDWVAHHVDPATAKAIWDDPQFWPPSRAGNLARLIEPHPFTMPPTGTWRRDQFGQYEVLVEMPIAACEPSEGDWDIAIQYWETQKYIEWIKAGLLPPPLMVCRSYRTGQLFCGNRRRWLAARAAGVETIMVWFSETAPPHVAHSYWWLPETGEYYHDTLNYIRQKSIDVLSSFDEYMRQRMGL